MKRSFLTALGIEKNIIDTILDEYNIELQTVREKSKEIADEYQEKVNQLNEKLKSKSSIDNSQELEDLKQKYEKLKSEYNDFKTQIQSKEDTEAKLSVLSKQLDNEKVNQKLIPLLLKEFDLENLKITNGTIENWNELFQPIRENYASFIGTDSTKGSDIATPPVNEPAVNNPFKKNEFWHYDLAKQTELYKKDPALASRLALEANYKL